MPLCVSITDKCHALHDKQTCYSFLTSCSRSARKHRPPIRTGQAQSSIYNCHTWRGGARSIASLDWADGKHGAFIISGSTDCTVCLWRPDGTLVGSFGPHSWDSDLPYTWQQQERLPLEVGVPANHVCFHPLSSLQCMQRVSSSCMHT